MCQEDAEYSRTEVRGNTFLPTSKHLTTAQRRGLKEGRHFMN